MGSRSLNLAVLLAVAVALSPLSASVTRPVVHFDPDGHGHDHVHFHGDHAHSHHHHHHDDGEDGDRDDHHDVIEDLPEGPTLVWTGPRRTEVDPPPTIPALPGAVLADASDWQPRYRAKPPPRSEPAPDHLNSIRTIVLRL